MDARIDEALRPFADAVSGFIFAAVPVAVVDIPFVLVWLIFAATLFTVYFGFINLRAFRHGFQLVRGDYSDPTAAGEVTHFQALATALSGTVGLGNIAGVAVAVSLGGPGATFWMILAGLLGMSSKFVECTLGVKYRNEYTDGTVSGGPMYYLSKGLAERSDRLKTLGRVLAVLFAVFCVGGSFGGGNMFQANQSFVQVLAVTGGESSWLAGRGWLFGVVLASLVGLVVIGGIQGIARVTSKIVPFMGEIYVLAGLSIIVFFVLASLLAPTSSRSATPAFVGIRAAMPGRRTPGSRPITSVDAAVTAPVLTAETKASACPSRNNPAPTTMEEFFLRRMAAAGASSIPMFSGAWTTWMPRPVADSRSRAAWTCASSPTQMRRAVLPSCRAAAMAQFEVSPPWPGR